MTPKKYSCLDVQFLCDADFKIETVQLKDIESIRQWRNSQMDVLRQKSVITAAQQRVYFDTHIFPSMRVGHPQNLLMSYFFQGQLIGYGGLVHISWENLRAEVSFLLDPSRVANPDVYARDFAKFLGLIKRLAFSELNLQRLFTETYIFRKLHISILESAGFEKEGVLKRHVLIDQKATDSVVHGCLNNDEK